MLVEAAALAAFLGPVVPSTRSPLVILVVVFVDLVVSAKVVRVVEELMRRRVGGRDFSVSGKGT